MREGAAVTMVLFIAPLNYAATGLWLLLGLVESAATIVNLAVARQREYAAYATGVRLDATAPGHAPHAGAGAGGRQLDRARRLSCLRCINADTRLRGNGDLDLPVARRPSRHQRSGRRHPARREMGCAPEQTHLANAYEEERKHHGELFDGPFRKPSDEHRPAFAPPAGPTVACPLCAQTTTRSLWNVIWPLTVNRCERCELVWFDRDELEVLQILGGTADELAPVERLLRVVRQLPGKRSEDAFEFALRLRIAERALETGLEHRSRRVTQRDGGGAVA